MTFFSNKIKFNKVLISLTGIIFITLQACGGGVKPEKPKASPVVSAKKHKQFIRKVKPEFATRAHLVYLLMLAEIAAQKGQLSLSVAAYLKATTLTNDPKIAERATRVASFARDYKSAMLSAERWAKLQPQKLDVQHSLIILYLRNNQIDKAMISADKVIALTEKKKVQGFSHLVALLSNEANKKAVLELMDRVVAKYKTRPQAWFAHARLALQFKKDDRALVMVSKAIKLKPDYEVAQALLARILMVQGKTDKALATMAGLVKAHPDSVAHRSSYARLLAIAKRYDRALIEFKKVLKKQPGNNDIVYAIALLTLEQSKLKESERNFKKLLSRKNRVFESYYYLGGIAEKRKQYKQAIRWYKKVRHGKNRLAANIRVAQLLAKQGKMKQARQYLHSLDRSDKSRAVRLYTVEIDILSKAGKYGAAMQVANQSLKQYIDDPDLLYARSLLAEKVNDLEQAEKDLKSILQREPNNVHALNALGYTLADRTTRYKEAYNYILKAYKLSPEEPAVLDSMGWVLYRMGKWPEAIKHLRKALALLQDDEIAAHLGEVLWVSGKQKEARKVWSRALKSVPESTHIRNAMKRLNKK